MKYHHQGASPVLGKGFVSLAAPGCSEYMVLSAFSALGLAHLSQLTGGREVKYIDF